LSTLPSHHRSLLYPPTLYKGQFGSVGVDGLRILTSAVSRRVMASGEEARVRYGFIIPRGDTESGCILPSMSEKRNSEESESSRLERLYREAKDPVLRTHLLMAWRMSVGDSVGEVARMVGYSQKWTRQIALRYESEGVEGLGDRRHSNPGAKERALLDEEGQARLRQALLEEAPPGGGMWSGPKVARWIEEKTGMEKVHAQRGWEYMRKVGMSPQVPRPSNAQGADAQEREAFKKSLR
jgi:transposase